MYLDPKVKAAKTKVKHFLNERLEKYQAYYCCTKGGKSFKSRSRGEKEYQETFNTWYPITSSTFQIFCSAFVKCRASDNRNFLEVIEMNKSHNHKISEDHFEPSQFQTRCSDGWRRLKATAVPSLFLHSESQQPAARTSGATLQVGLLTQPLPTTSGACFVSIFQGPAYPRVAIPPRSSPQVTSDNQRGQASSAARGTLVSADTISWQPAARTSGAALQGGLLTQPLPTTSGACFVSIFQGPAYPRVAIPPRSSPQVTSDNQRGQASSAARGTLVSADPTSWQPAARTSGAALQGGLLTQPLPTTSGACFVSIFQGPAYPRVAIPPHPSLQVTSDNQRGQASAAALGTLVSADTISWQPAARTSGAALQGGLLTQPLPTTSGACFVSIFQGPAYPRVAIPPHPSLQVTSDNQRGQASAAALGTLVSAASTSWPLSPSPVSPRLTEDVFLQMSRKIKQLENENHRLVRQAALQKTREATFRSHLHEFFTVDQLAALSRSSNRGSKWSNETVKKSLQMRSACGSLGYDLLLEGSFPLPSSRTLGRRLEGKFVVRLLKCFKAPC
ncbi:hypothetical protein ISCGN_014381 [Ixodes scapularis]